ncbi:MAG TPA: hypothetical protein VKP30_17710, partial [Polyangiaceae bacterium]|nr:hypothetical protein [Polyangiaceae bacterium]
MIDSTSTPIPMVRKVVRAKLRLGGWLSSVGVVSWVLACASEPTAMNAVATGGAQSAGGTTSNATQSTGGVTSTATENAGGATDVS